MQKDFDAWNARKKQLDTTSRRLLYKQGEVWWCEIGLNVADESCGKGNFFARPVLILKKLSHQNYLGIPLSTKKKTGTWFAKIRVQGEEVTALLYQMRMFSAARLQRRLTTLDASDFDLIKERLKLLLELS